jgi:hypothetical protein
MGGPPPGDVAGGGGAAPSASSKAALQSEGVTNAVPVALLDALITLLEAKVSI